MNGITIGDPLPRVDGPAKVTGTAKFSAEYSIPGLVYASLVMSSIPSGRVQLSTTEAERAPGVLAVITPANVINPPAPEHRLSLLQDDQVYYQNQPIAIVVAETLEQAHYGASLVQPQYQATPAKLDFLAGFPASYPGSHNNEPGDQSWGDVDAGLKNAALRIDQVYTTPIHHHNPMEPHATIARWDGDRLNLYDATQHITGVQEAAAKLFARRCNAAGAGLMGRSSRRISGSPPTSPAPARGWRPWCWILRKIFGPTRNQRSIKC